MLNHITCPSNAISFERNGQTEREQIQRLVKDYNIVKKAKKALAEREDEFRLP